MSLRFQKEDEVDRAAKEGGHHALLIFLGVLFAVIHGLFAWSSGESLASYEKDLAWLIGFGFVYWIVAPFYYEFRIRTKEIDGKVSAIEEALNASREDHAELLERLTVMEEKLDGLSENVERHSSDETIEYSSGGIREGLRKIDAKSHGTEIR